VALVANASSGIGQAAAVALVDAGVQVAGTSRDASRVAVRDGVTFLDLDVTSDESASTVVEQVIARYGRIDVLVDNAGVGSAGAAEELSVAQDQRVFDVNVFGVIQMTDAVLPHMRAQGVGRVITISSPTIPFDRDMVQTDTPCRSTPSNGTTSTTSWQRRSRKTTTRPSSTR
jgi:NAD(P)-dependent dehydrogenase (short-subunit alcohol dehydrogenase family)